jgi:predicted PilT family ATPase
MIKEDPIAAYIELIDLYEGKQVYDVYTKGERSFMIVVDIDLGHYVLVKLYLNDIEIYLKEAIQFVIKVTVQRIVGDEHYSIEEIYSYDHFEEAIMVATS